MVKSNELERAVYEGRLDWHEFNIESQNVVIVENERFPHFSSSRTYPGWGVVGTANTDQEVRFNA